MIKSPFVVMCAAFFLTTGASASNGLKNGPWRAWLDSPGGELPFGLLIEGEGSALAAAILNGSERIDVPGVKESAEGWVLAMPHYDSRIVFQASKDGKTLDGEWSKRIGTDEWSRLPFHATYGKQPRFAPYPGRVIAHERIDGRWRLQFSQSEDPAVGIFESTSATDVAGTILTTTGDYRYLAGSFEARRLRLSVFDGAHAFLFDATLQDDGILRGDFWSRDSWHEEFSGTRADDVELPDAFSQTTWVADVPLQELRFPDLTGRVRSLADPEFRGKARILYLFGSWCPNCHDATATLRELKAKYGDQGLSIVGLAFELSDDFDRNVEQLRVYANRHGIDWPLLIAGPADKQAATEEFLALDRVRSYPTTVFVDAEGRVKAVHTGFTGPATGEEYTELRRRFAQLIQELLAAADGES